MAIRLALAVVGDKGYHFLRDVSDRYDVVHVFTYPQRASCFSVDDFRTTSLEMQAELHVGSRPSLHAADADLVFTVGWQYLFGDPPENLVILHDSLLPKYRGFAPTVAALIAGDTTLGVSAIRPAPDFDGGSVLAQSTVKLDGPVRVAEAFERLRPAYQRVVDEVCRLVEEGIPLRGSAQDESAATYSSWLDDLDYALDWSLPADVLHRQVLAQSAPYDCSVTATYDGRLYRVPDATPVPDVTLVNRAPGKVWRASGMVAEVICGIGMLRVHLQPQHAVSTEEKVSLRTRFASVEGTRLILTNLSSS